MGLLEMILVLIICVIIAALLDRAITRVSLPLIQIAVGFVAGLIVPMLGDVEVESELFLVLFIAPLLFNEAREASRAELWDKKWAILSMAIGLVLLTVLVIGFALHALVPSIPLAAAFACAGALGPTDAAAVGALGSTVKLSERQRTLLSGESLINDASGVVSFNFAIAAAVTGAFSLAEATAEFALLFFGGIAVGVVAGFLAVGGILLVRSRGFEDTTVNVLYEVLTPFVVFLAAEAMGVSGILAVVACGLVMARSRPRLSSATVARHRMVSNSFWEIIVYLINGVIFVLLGIQLVQVFSPQLAASVSLPVLLGIIVVVTALVILVRFFWVGILDLIGVDPHTDQRGIKHVAHTLHDSLVTTIAGPKGAVTLSIIFTIPMTVADGSPFPERNLIITLTAGVILLTLVVADVFLPILSPMEDTGDDDEALTRASIAVLEGTIDELQRHIGEGTKPEYEPATRLAIRSYRTRLARMRLSSSGCGEQMREMVDEVLDVQQRRADEIQDKGLAVHDGKEAIHYAAPYFVALRGIRASIGYYEGATKVGSRRFGLRGAFEMFKLRISYRIHRNGPGGERSKDADRVYYETCLFARELETAAIDYLQSIIDDDPEGPDDSRAGIAKVLMGEHEASIRSLDERLQYGRDAQLDDPEAEASESQSHFREQFRRARQYANDVNAGALSIELEQIRHLQEQGQIGEKAASKLRDNVYMMQMGLQE